MGMTERDRKVLAVVVVAIILGGYWFLVLGKKRSAITEAEAARTAAQQKLTAATAAEAAAKELQAVKPASYSKILKLGKAIPVDDDFQSLLVQVSDLSDDSDVSFVSLTAGEGAAAGAAAGAPAAGASGATGPAGGATTCDAPAADPAAGASGATAVPTPPPTGSTAESFAGQSRDKANGAVAATNDASTAAEQAAKCADSPTLTDITAKSAGLTPYDYTFTFNGSFYNLHKVYNGILDMVQVHNGRVKVTGRLLDINSITMSVAEFPNLTASVQMTGYVLPMDTGLTAATQTTADPAAAAANTGTDASGAAE